MNEPLVQILVPVYNGDDHLRECLESILKQGYSNWRGMIVNNCSTDKTADIAEEFCRRDKRLQVTHCQQLVGQAENYNRAVGLADPHADYVKIVEADNWITEDCLARMVGVAEREPQVGLVGCYYLWGRELLGAGVDYKTQSLSGNQLLWLMFNEERYLLGTPTTLLFRAAALREETPCFRPGLFYDDAELCIRLLRKWRFGYVHQILAFHRRDNQGILSTFREFDYIPAYRYFLIEDYGADHLNGTELKTFRRECERTYFSRLGRAVLNRKPAAYWKFHEQTFQARGRKLRKTRLLVPVLRELADLLLNPKSTVERILRSRRRTQLRARAVEQG